MGVHKMSSKVSRGYEAQDNETSTGEERSVPETAQGAPGLWVDPADGHVHPMPETQKVAWFLDGRTEFETRMPRFVYDGRTYLRVQGTGYESFGSELVFAIEAGVYPAVVVVVPYRSDG